MISTANYIARKSGVRSAMPGFIALKLCPHLIIKDIRMSVYKDTSRAMVNIITQYDKDY
jgi:DNA polymerase kappa